MPEILEEIKTTYSIKEILATNQQRYPFVMIDKIIDLTPDSVVAVKNVSFNEPFFQGHFPENPVMPGVLLQEAMAQAASFYIAKIHKQDPDQNIYFATIKDTKFFRFVQPGDVLMIEGVFIRSISKYLQMNMKGIVDGKVVATSELTCFIQ
jgi:beta-hydroxyacyl-ACP dehydratase FabZ